MYVVLITSHICVSYYEYNKNVIFTIIIATFYVEISVKWSTLRVFRKNINWNMCENLVNADAWYGKYW